MAHVAFTNLRNNLKQHLDAVISGGEPLFCTRAGRAGGPASTVVILSEKEYLAWQDVLLKAAHAREMTEAAD